MARMSAGAQSGLLTGVVTESTTGRPLEGARVMVTGSKVAAITDRNGSYRIGSVPAMFASEPRLTPSIRDGNPLIAPASKYTPGLQYGVIVFRPSLLVTNRDLGQRFINAYLRSVRQYNQGMTKRNTEIIARRADVGADTVRSLCVPPIRKDGGLDFESLLDFQKWGVERGYQIRTLSTAEFADLEFVQKAAANLNSEAAGR